MLGDSHLAEDVTQQVFLELARNAKRLANHPVIAGWLYRTTRNIAANLIRAESRRRIRDQEAFTMNDNDSGAISWDQIASGLDSCLEELDDHERELVLLRYFHGKSAHEIGLLLAVSEEAAQKRVSRAIERLRAVFAHRGLALSSASLAAILETHATQAAPVLLVSSISKLLFTGASPGAYLTAAAMTTSQKAIVAVSIAAVIGTGVFEWQQYAAGQRREAAPGHDQDQVAELRRRSEVLSQENTSLRAANDQLRRDAVEVHKLRGDIAQLREQLRQQSTPWPSLNVTNTTEAALKGWLDRTEQFKALLARMPDKTIPELRLLNEQDWLEMAKEWITEKHEWNPTDDVLARRVLAIAREKAKLKLPGAFYRALRAYVAAHEGRLPPDMIELGAYFEPPLEDSLILSRYQVLYTGRFEDIPNDDSTTILIAERTPADPEDDSRLVLGKHWYKSARGGDPASWPEMPAPKPLAARHAH
jgi:RNA polymerase sigma factor (sigma-70 family)